MNTKIQKIFWILDCIRKLSFCINHVLSEKNDDAEEYIKDCINNLNSALKNIHTKSDS